MSASGCKYFVQVDMKKGNRRLPIPLYKYGVSTIFSTGRSSWIQKVGRVLHHAAPAKGHDGLATFSMTTSALAAGDALCAAFRCVSSNRAAYTS